MNVLIISGFLGAGKTTFIRELIKRTDGRLVILENEYGSADVDQQVIKAEDKADVWDLTEGCVCCTKSADFNASVLTIESTLEPELLVVEPSGVGALSNVIRNLRKIEYERIVLLRPLTIVDADHFAHDCKEFPDIYLEAAARLGVAPEACVVFEDLLAAMHTAREAGMTVVGVLTGEARQNVAAIVEACDYIVDDWRMFE